MKASNILYTIALAIVLLAGGPAAWAANTWKVDYVTSSGKFKISRSGDTSITETVQYRTVSLSAIAGQHFTERTGTVTFGAGDTDKEIAVAENTPGTAAYLYQNGTSRKYRFEVLDQGGFRLAYKDRTITTGTSVPSSGLFSEKEITIYTDELEYNDAGYDKNTNNPHYINSSSYYNLSGIAPVAYYTLIGAELRSTLSFDAKEKANGYQYVQILINNTSSCDNRKDCSNGDPGNISLSRYMAGFDHQPSSTNTTYAAYTFPVLSQPDNNQNPVDNAWNNGVTNKLYKQKFNTNCRATDGRLILPLDFNTFVVRFNASGGGSSDKDEWFAKNVKAHIQAVDGTAPSRLGDPVVSGSMHAKGNTFYVSVPFREIVTVSGTPTLSTTWGSASYVSSNGGSGSNVLTFSGTITADAGTTLTVNSISGTIKDLAGNELNSAGKTINKDYGTTVDASASYSITYDLAGGTIATANPTTYTYETAAFTLNNPTRLGYWFNGWTGSNGSTPSTTVTISNHSHGNRTYTANWIQVWTGSGTQGDPYVISSTQGLDLLAQYVNSGNNCSGVYFQLGDDIAYTYTTDWNNSTSQEDNYTAIGTRNSTFQGTFDGQGHTVSGIRLYRGGHNTDDCHQGLFGYISGGTVRAVNLADARITGCNEVGGIAGYIFSSTVEDCSVAADVCIHAAQSSSWYHGGIVGDNQGTVRRCLSRAILTVADTSVCQDYGAILGKNNTSGHALKDCIAISAIVPSVNNAGAITGNNDDNSSYYVQHNYYRACTVAGTANATGVGVGSDKGDSSPHDLTANQGAQALYSITLPDGVTLVRTASATLPGTGNKTYDTGADIDGTPYAYDGATLRLSYTGDALAEGYTYAVSINGTRATDNGNGTYTATMPAADATVTVSTVAKDFTADGHSGDSEADAYIIYNNDQLDLLAKMVNGTDGYAANTFEGKYIKLANDITYTHTSDWNNSTSQEHNYTAIGIYSGNTRYYFQGTFDGDNHTVSGIRIYKNGTSNSDKYQGLFGYVGGSGTVKNVTVSDARITGSHYAGSIVGTNLGTVTNCHASNTVAITSVSNTPANYHGGIVGNNGTDDTFNGTILNCTSASTLTANSQEAIYYGSIAGQNRGRIENCHAVYASIPALERVFGVITGHNSGTLTANYYRSCTIGDTANGVNVGVGSSSGAPADQAGARSVHSLTLPVSVTATGESVDIDATTYYAAGATVTLSHGSVPAGYEAFEGYSLDGTPIDGNTFTMPAADAIVTARWTVIDFESGHAGTEADPYIIYNKDQLDQLASNVNGGTSYSGKFIKLGADIEYPHTTDWDDATSTENNYTSIGSTEWPYFQGTFDGDGHTVSGIRICNGNGDDQGLFGEVIGGTVRNLTLTDARITGRQEVGGIAGYITANYGLGGLIENCHVTASVAIHAAADYSRNHGGIAGKVNGGTVRGCSSAATLTIADGISNCDSYGGIAGFLGVNLQNCLILSANIPSLDCVGAIVGNSRYIGPTISHNYYYGCTVNGTSNASNVGFGSYSYEDDYNEYNGDITANDGAIRAESSTTKPAEIGAQIASYSNGLTVYEHGAYYNGTYYLRHDLAGTATALTLTPGTKDGVSAYWGTFYDSATNYTLSEGAAAYTLGSDHNLYRLGDDGRTIPKGVAVVIIATSADASLFPAGTGDLSITDHAPGGNTLVGNDIDTSYPTIYVLSVNDLGEIGFRKLSTGTLPTHKAGYEPQGGMQDYDKQGNQEW